jgi:hypothetical protein
MLRLTKVHNSRISPDWLCITRASWFSTIASTKTGIGAGEVEVAVVVAILSAVEVAVDVAMESGVDVATGAGLISSRCTGAGRINKSASSMLIVCSQLSIPA